MERDARLVVMLVLDKAQLLQSCTLNKLDQKSIGWLLNSFSEFIHRKGTVGAEPVELLASRLEQVRSFLPLDVA